MRMLIAGLGLLGLVTVAACSYTVEMPSTDSRSPSVDTTETPQSEDSVPAGHGTLGMQSMGSPHGDMSGMMGGMSPHSGMMGSVPPSRTIPIGSKLVLQAPASWEPVQPSSSMLQNEFSVPAVEGDANDGRVTVMSAGGSIQANIDRWIGQFSQPDGSATAEKAKTEKLDIAGCEVHMVDISGTYADSRGMMGPVVQRPDYRMLAAIIVAPEATYFVKFYGPQKTVASQADAFRKMITGLGEPKADAEQAAPEKADSQKPAAASATSEKAEKASEEKAESEKADAEKGDSEKAADDKPAEK